MDSKQCGKCKEIKSINDFGVRTDRPCGRLHICKKCANARCRDYYARRHEQHLCKACGEPFNEGGRKYCRKCLDLAEGKRRVVELTVDGRAKANLRRLRARTKATGQECTISLEWMLRKLRHGKCELTGIPFDLSPVRDYHINPLSPSIDRIDNNVGYTESNCRMLVTAMNVAMNRHGESMFRTLAEAYLARNPVA